MGTDIVGIHRHRLAVIVTASMIITFLIIDVIIPPLVSTSSEAESGILPAILFGMMIGQINLIATWTTLAPGNFVQRFSWSLLLLVWTWYGTVIGFRWMVNLDGFYRGDLTFDVAMMGLILLTSFVTAQIPLWIAGKALRWSLVSWIGSVDRRVRYRLKHLLLAMLAIAITIGPGKLILPSGKWNLTEFANAPIEFWISMAVTLATNVLITIPSLWIAFAKTWTTVFAIYVWLIYCSFITGVEIAIFVSVWSGVDNALYPYLVVWLFNFTQFAVIYGALAIFRAIGFQFIRLPRKKDHSSALPTLLQG